MYCLTHGNTNIQPQAIEGKMALKLVRITINSLLKIGTRRVHVSAKKLDSRFHHLL
jgi:hypothetical protein